MTDTPREPDDDAMKRLLEDAEGGIEASELTAPAGQPDADQLPPNS